MSRSRNFLCTWNNYPEDWKDIIKGCGAIDYSAQREKGKDAEKEHIQFCVRFAEARQFTAIQKMFVGAHIEIAKDWVKCYAYCQKKDTQVEAGIVAPEKYVCRDPLEGKVLRPIQKEILDLVNRQADDRSIHWFWDPLGAMGKTTIAKHICMHNAGAIYLTGKSADMKYGVMSWLSSGKNLKVVLIDLTRSVEAYVSYQGIEEIKNGIFYNTKYESGMCMFDNPHVIILSNFLPEVDALREDRWEVHDYSPDVM